VLIDGEKKDVTEINGKYKVKVGNAAIVEPSKQGINYALNISRKGYPEASASINTEPDSLNQAIDGRIWYFPEISNRWSTEGSTSSTDWYAIDFGQTRELSRIETYLYTDDENFGLPGNYTIQYKNGNEWSPLTSGDSTKLVGNTKNTIVFNKISTTSVRITFKHETKPVALVELACYQ